MQALPGVQGCVASAPPVGQSRVRPCELVVTQVRPVRGPRSQVPVPGLPGLPVAEHLGHGWSTFPVRIVSDCNGTFVVEVPVARSSVPVAGAVQVLSTQVL